jgi:hypothetical protein
MGRQAEAPELGPQRPSPAGSKTKVFPPALLPKPQDQFIADLLDFLRK